MNGSPSAAEESIQAPAWFHEMDRNHDGAVERSEFLGSEEQFKKLDANHDGLITPAEARTAFPDAPLVGKAVAPQKPQKPPKSKN